MKDLDDGKAVDKVCSKKCENEYNKNHRIPYAKREHLKNN